VEVCIRLYLSILPPSIVFDLVGKLIVSRGWCRCTRNDECINAAGSFLIGIDNIILDIEIIERRRQLDYTLLPV
jgi:hypothetical protein